MEEYDVKNGSEAQRLYTVKIFISYKYIACISCSMYDMYILFLNLYM